MRLARISHSQCIRTMGFGSSFSFEVYHDLQSRCVMALLYLVSWGSFPLQIYSICPPLQHDAPDVSEAALQPRPCDQHRTRSADIGSFLYCGVCIMCRGHYFVCLVAGGLELLLRESLMLMIRAGLSMITILPVSM